MDISEVRGCDLHIKGLLDYDINELSRLAGFHDSDDMANYALRCNEPLYDTMNPYMNAENVEELLVDAFKAPEDLLLISMAYYKKFYRV